MINYFLIRWPIIFLIALTVIFTFPFFQEGYFLTDDGEWAVVRLTEMVRELRDFQIPPNWSNFLNHGFGYPLFLFTYPLPYYMGSILRIFGISYVSIIKLIFSASVLFGSIGMYLFTKRYWQLHGGLISATLYMVAPYKLMNLYQRGSIGETMVMGIAPWLLWSLDRWFDKKKYAGMICALLLASTILSHNIGGLLFTGYFVLYLIFNRSKRRILSSLFIVIQGLLISSFFWLPAIIEKKYIYLSKFPIADKGIHFASIVELLMPVIVSPIRPQLFLGSLHLLSVVFAVYLFMTGKIKNKIIFFFNFFVFVLSVFMVIPVSRGFWNISLLSSIDFPWRILMISIFTMSILGGAAAITIKNRLYKLILISLIIFLNISFTKIGNRITKPDVYYETNDAKTTSNDELMPIWVIKKPTNRPEISIVGGQIESFTQNSRLIKFTGIFKNNEIIILNSLYFPGWTFWIDGNKTIINPEPGTGLISINIPSGWHSVEGKFLATPIRFVSRLLSLLGLLSLIVQIIILRR